MVEGTYLTFAGQRKKKTPKARWSNITAKIPMSDIVRVALVDNSDTSSCLGCEFYNPCGMGCTEEYCCNDDYGPNEKTSFIEVESDTHIYKVCETRLFDNEDGRRFMNNLLASIMEGKLDVNIPMLEEKRRQEREKKHEAERLAYRRSRYLRKLKQRKQCGKCCALQDGSCVLGWNVAEGIPQEPCIRPDAKSKIDFIRNEIKEFQES